MRDPLPRIEILPLRRAALEGHPNALELLIQVIAPPLPADHKPKPLALALVIDRSGSMNGAPLDEAKRCAELVRSRLGAGDRVALVDYSDEARLVLGLNAPSAQTFRDALEGVVASGQTNLMGGWELAAELLREGAEGCDVRRVMLLSDGRLNSGVTQPQVIRARCEALLRQGVSTSTYGLGVDFDEKVMRLMAEVGGGRARYGERVEDLMEPFVEELDLLTQLYASRLTLKVTPAPGVTLSCANGLPAAEGGGLILPDVAYGAQVWAGFTGTASAEALRSGAPLVRVELLGGAAEGAGVRAEASLSLPLLGPAAFEAVAKDPLVEKYLSELNVSELRDQAAEAAERRDWATVERLVQQMRALPSTEWLARQILELERFTRLRERELMMKESRMSSSSARFSNQSGARGYMSGEGEKLYLSKKHRFGRALEEGRTPPQPLSPPEGDGGAREGGGQGGRQ